MKANFSLLYLRIQIKNLKYQDLRFLRKFTSTKMVFFQNQSGKRLILHGSQFQYFFVFFRRKVFKEEINGIYLFGFV